MKFIANTVIIFNVDLMRGISCVTEQLLLCRKQRGVIALIGLVTLEKGRIYFKIGRSVSAYCV
jgi:hypothetical protein